MATLAHTERADYHSCEYETVLVSELVTTKQWSHRRQILIAGELFVHLTGIFLIRSSLKKQTKSAPHFMIIPITLVFNAPLIKNDQQLDD